MMLVEEKNGAGMNYRSWHSLAAALLSVIKSFVDWPRVLFAMARSSNRSYLFHWQNKRAVRRPVSIRRTAISPTARVKQPHWPAICLTKLNCDKSSSENSKEIALLSPMNKLKPWKKVSICRIYANAVGIDWYSPVDRSPEDIFTHIPHCSLQSSTRHIIPMFMPENNWPTKSSSANKKFR